MQHPNEVSPVMVYLAAPMSGLDGDNKAAMNAQAAGLRRAGVQVINPAELDHPAEPKGSANAYYRRDVIELARQCNLMAVMDGWEDSWGVGQIEFPLARGLRMPIVNALAFQAALIPMDVWPPNRTALNVHHGVHVTVNR